MSAHARLADPDTSHEAAASISEKKLRASQEAVYQLLRAYGPMSNQLLEGLYAHLGPLAGPPQTPQSLRSRRKELENLGRVRWTGTYVVLDSGRRARVWQAVA